MNKQAYNPFLPLWEYIPDGEPRVFGDRVYLFGSHDQENGDTFCMLPYTFYSAPVNDLSNWTTHGDSYQLEQDPLANEERHYMYAPDVVQGKDGRYYLYYCLAGYKGEGGYQGPISVAVCDRPDGKYEYLGVVKNTDGSAFTRFIPFDPAVINDAGVIRLYYGTLYDFEDRLEGVSDPMMRSRLYQHESKLFGKTVEELEAAEPEGVMGPVTVTLAEDMLTVISEPVRLIPAKVKGTQWEEHPFFEGSSIRKIGDTYYFIYSSRQNHELCYATSKHSDHDFVFRGTIVSNGDIGYQGRGEKDRLNITGTTHGSMECINGQWYIFYHRLTHASDYSRQACAQPIEILRDGSIPQVELTSCGLNGGSLAGKGEYPAVICCNLTNGDMPHSSNKHSDSQIPCISSGGGERFVHAIVNDTWVGYKYFNYHDTKRLRVVLRGNASGRLEICTWMESSALAVITVEPEEQWTGKVVEVPFPEGKAALFLHYLGTGALDILCFELS